MATLGTFTAGQVLTAAELNAIGTWTTFTPSWTNFTPGNAVQDWSYTIVNDIMVVSGITTLGSTSVMGTEPRMTIPASRTAKRWSIGVATMRDAGVATQTGIVQVNGPSETVIRMTYSLVSGVNVRIANVSSTAPFTWAVNDYFSFTIVMDVTP